MLFFYGLKFKLLVVFDFSTTVVRLWFLGRSDFTFYIIDITSQFISFVLFFGNDVKLQDVGVYNATTYTTYRPL